MYEYHRQVFSVSPQQHCCDHINCRSGVIHEQAGRMIDDVVALSSLDNLVSLSRCCSQLEGLRQSGREGGSELDREGSSRLSLDQPYFVPRRYGLDLSVRLLIIYPTSHVRSYLDGLFLPVSCVSCSFGLDEGNYLASALRRSQGYAMVPMSTDLQKTL